jgi:hypothetical protein
MPSLSHTHTHTHTHTQIDGTPSYTNCKADLQLTITFNDDSSWSMVANTLESVLIDSIRDAANTMACEALTAPPCVSDVSENDLRQSKVRPMCVCVCVCVNILTHECVCVHFTSHTQVRQLLNLALQHGLDEHLE